MINNGTYPNLILLDVRLKSSYDKGHLSNAINIPVTQLDSRIDELLQYNETEIIVYCQTGETSKTAAATLDFHGFTKVFNLTGGINAWESAGYSVIPELSSIMLTSTFVILTTLVFLLKRRKHRN